MTAYVLRRLVQLPFVLLIISILIFSLMHLAPGDPVSWLVDMYATPRAIEALRSQYHLDKPLHEQYLLWLFRVLQGDLGRSIHTGQPVAEMFFGRLGVNLVLTSLATILSLAIAIPVGILSAYKHNSTFDNSSMFLAVSAYSIPNFALALILILLFSLKLEWLPVTGIGMTSLFKDPWRAISPYILPVIAIAAWQTAMLTRLLRASMLEALGQNYITSARAKGVKESMVLAKHALRNAIIPLITILTINFVFLLGSTVTIEKVFAIPGVGTVLIRAVNRRDFPVIQGVTLLIALFYVVANLATDITNSYIDPRIRYDRTRQA